MACQAYHLYRPNKSGTVGASSRLGLVTTLDQRKHIAAKLKDYLARERISREQFAFKTKLGKSTVDKLLTGLFSERTLAIVESHTKLSLRPASEETGPETDATKSPAPAAIPIVDKPSIAVLPFANFSPDPDQQYFADGVVEDVITALSHIPRLFVIARNSTFTYRDKAIDVRQIGRELGVRYILEGSVRRAGKRLRISGQLVDAATGAHLWAERYDGVVDDVFDLQDRITASVVGAIAPRLFAAELERTRTKRPENLGAYDCYLRATAALGKMTLAGNEEALAFVDRALRIEPTYAVAAGLGAWAYSLRAAQNWSGDHAADRKRGLEFGRAAIANGPDDPEALAMGGYAIAFLGDEFEDGLNLLERSIELNPNSAMALSHSGWVKCYLGRAHDAIADFQKSVQLSPREITLFRMHAGLALANLLLEDFGEAVRWGRQAVKSNPNYTPAYRPLVAALAHLGRNEEARNVARQLRDLVPDFTTATEERLFRNSGKLPLILHGLRAAGL